jgi:hypothetical protein
MPNAVSKAGGCLLKRNFSAISTEQNWLLTVFFFKNKRQQTGWSELGQFFSDKHHKASS